MAILPASTLVDIVSKCRILNTSVRFVPGKDLNNAAQDPGKYFHTTVGVAFPLPHAEVSTSFYPAHTTDRAIAKRILRTINPQYGHNGKASISLRLKSVKTAVYGLVSQIRSASDQAMATADTTNIHDRIRKLYKTRHKREMKERMRASVQAITDAIIAAPDITMQDLEDIWKNCQARVVMEG